VTLIAFCLLRISLLVVNHLSTHNVYDTSGEIVNISVQSLDDIRNRELQIMELQKKLLDSESKIKQQQNLYESVRTERNLYSKNLVQAQDEIDEMKRKFKVMAHLVEQLKEEVASRDHALMKEHEDHLKVDCA
jgi:RAB protein geranylgeranyltransferase component A